MFQSLQEISKLTRSSWCEQQQKMEELSESSLVYTYCQCYNLIKNERLIVLKITREL